MHLTQSLEKYSKYREVFRIFCKKKKDKPIVKSPANDLWRQKLAILWL